MVGYTVKKILKLQFQINLNCKLKLILILKFLFFLMKLIQNGRHNVLITYNLCYCFRRGNGENVTHTFLSGLLIATRQKCLGYEKASSQMIEMTLFVIHVRHSRQTKGFAKHCDLTIQNTFPPIKEFV